MCVCVNDHCGLSVCESNDHCVWVECVCGVNDHCVWVECVCVFLQPPLTTVSGARPRVYSRLPGFPTVRSPPSHPHTLTPSQVPEGEEGPLTNGTGAHPRHSRLDNPYDTIHTSPPSPPPSHHHRPHKPPTLTPSPSGVYSEPGEITCESHDYHLPISYHLCS